MGKSALGPAIKAGGPNYVSQFMNFADTGLPPIKTLKREHALLRMALEWRRKLLWGQLGPYKEDLTKAIRAIKSYLYHAEQEFWEERDYFHLRGQDNLHRYRPLGTVAVGLHPADSPFDVLARVAATRIAGNIAVISIPRDMDNAVTAFLDTLEGRQITARAIVRRQSDEELMASMGVGQRIRYAAHERVPEAVLAAAARKGFYVARAPVLMEGRIEMLHYCQNKSICDSYHRYGNLGDRSILK